MKNAMSKRLTALCLALCLALPLAGCSGKEESSAANRLEAIKERRLYRSGHRTLFCSHGIHRPHQGGGREICGCGH